MNYHDLIGTGHLRTGTHNQNRIAIHMVKDALDESNFDAGPGGFIPSRVGNLVSGAAEMLRSRTDPDRR